MSDTRARQTLEASASTIQAQISSPTPSRSILRAALTTARVVIEGAGGSLLAAGIGGLLG